MTRHQQTLHRGLKHLPPPSEAQMLSEVHWPSVRASPRPAKHTVGNPYKQHLRRPQRCLFRPLNQSTSLKRRRLFASSSNVNEFDATRPCRPTAALVGSSLPHVPNGLSATLAARTSSQAGYLTGTHMPTAPCLAKTSLPTTLVRVLPDF